MGSNFKITIYDTKKDEIYSVVSVSRSLQEFNELAQYLQFKLHGDFYSIENTTEEPTGEYEKQFDAMKLDDSKK